MPEIEQKSFQRQVAYKVRISDIIKSSLFKDVVSAGYIKLNNINVSRVNVIGTIVYLSEQGSSFKSALIDDGTGRISLRAFEESNIFSRIEIGDIVLMIGKLRQFNDEKYVMPEILKKLGGIEWLSLRKAELAKNHANIGDAKAAGQEASVKIYEYIYSLVKSLDIGDGVSVEDVIRKSANSDAEKIINKLLENGDIFEIKPGKLKVLE